MSTYKFYWIDDTPQRITSFENFKEKMKVGGKFFGVKNKNLGDEVKSIIQRPEPDLIIVDHKLQDVSSGEFKTGSTLAEVIRETWPNCPIVCVSNVDPNDIGERSKSIYDEVFSLHNFSSHYVTVKSIAQSYRKLKSNPPTNVNELLKMLKAPESEYEKLVTILPQEIKLGFQIPMISKWIRKTLIERPGFLYDQLWTSTYLGIKEDSFSKVEDLFEKVKYKGLFYDESAPRWWKRGIIEQLSKNVRHSSSNLPWVKGRLLPGIVSEDYSKCYVTRKDFPETVAYTDSSISSRRHPMRLEETVPHPQFQDLLFFDEIKMMNGE